MTWEKYDVDVALVPTGLPGATPVEASGAEVAREAINVSPPVG